MSLLPFSRSSGIWSVLLTPLAVRIALAVGSALLVIGGAFGYLAHRTDIGLLEKQAYSKTHAVAAVSKVILEHIMVAGKRQHLERALSSALESEQASEVFVLRTNGAVAYRSMGEASMQPAHSMNIDVMPGTVNERYKMHNIDGVYSGTIILPLENKKECLGCHGSAGPYLGYLYVTVSLNDLSETAIRHRHANILSTVVAFLSIGGVIFVSLLFLVIRPLTRLQAQIHLIEYRVERIGDGDKVVFSPLEAEGATGEIADVIVAFNSVVRKLNDAHERLFSLHHHQLEQADRIASVGEMAAGLAHEIRNPLAGVQGALQVLSRDYPDGHPHRPIIGEMLEQLGRMNQTISDLLMYARPAAPAFEQIDLRTLLHRIVPMLQAQFASSSVDIAGRLPADPVVIDGDTKLLQQVFWNLIQNGAQAAGANGHVIVELSSMPGGALVLVRDDGPGIPPDVRATMFKPFFTTKAKGTGLGLAISRRIVEQHGGTLTVSDTGREGTTLRVELPEHAQPAGAEE